MDAYYIFDSPDIIMNMSTLPNPTETEPLVENTALCLMHLCGQSMKENYWTIRTIYSRWVMQLCRNKRKQHLEGANELRKKLK